MSIEITGPLKYRLQDQVCALLAVLGSNCSEVSLQIEPEDGEDALLTLVSDGRIRTLEVQVKGANARITQDVLSAWLAHFPGRVASGSLLERLLGTPDNSVLFVASGRCTDDVLPHAVDISIHTTELKFGSISAQLENGVRTKLQEYATARKKNDSTLSKKRRASFGKMLEITSSDSLKESLQRVLIAEQLDETAILRRIRDKLESDHGVVPDRVEGVRRSITDIVVRQKRTGVDVIPEVRKVIESAVAVDPLVAASYVRRGEEEALLSALTETSALLITGAPRVGKSSCARSLAFSLQAMGYSVRVCADVAEAERYLSEPVVGNRAALVDDPLGGAHAADNASRELMLLGKLIPKLGNGRRLIISQAQDRLLEVYRCKKVSDVRTGGLAWTEMGIGDVSFLAMLWTGLAADYAVPKHLEDQVAEAILTGRLDLEPGCLVYLAVNHQRLDVGVSLNEVIRYARQDSKDLGDALRREELAPIASALAIASTPVLWVGESDLAFVLDDERTDLPGESDVRGTMTSVSGPESTFDSAPHPSYSPQPTLSNKQAEALDKLELRRMISVRSRRYTFNHPFYRASAESLVDAATQRSVDQALSLVRRALFTIDADTARAAATNLGWIHRSLDSDDGRKGVVELAIRGLRSIFPVVRDLCFEFLVRRLGTLALDQQSKLSKWVSRVTFMKLSYVDWSGEQPRIPAADSAGMLRVDPFPSPVSLEQVRAALQHLNSTEPSPISVRDAARAVTFLEQSPDRLTSQMAARLLSVDISMIRAPVVSLWLSQPRSGDRDLLERIFGEQHPAVTLAAYNGVLRAWHLCDDERRRTLTRGLQAMADSPVSAAVLIDHLVVVNRKEFGGERTPWELFEALMPRVLRQLPLGASIRDERLYHVMDQAIGEISSKSLVEIVDSWIAVIQRFVPSRVPSDYMLGVSDILISGVTSKSGQRKARIEALLDLPGTAVRMRVVSDLVDAWASLSAEERSILLEHLTTEATDWEWLKAAALTRSLVPAQIQAALLPDRVSLDLAPEEILDNLSPQLLEACLQVFTGSHPVIYYVGTHGSRSTVWKAVIRRVVRMPEHAMFEICWEWLSSAGESEELADVARDLGTKYADRLASLLLMRKQRTSGEFMPEVWEALFDLPVDDGMRSEWLTRMAALAPTVLDRLAEHSSWVPAAWRKEFLSHFENDLMLQKLLGNLLLALRGAKIDQSAEHAELWSGIVDVVDSMLEHKPPKHGYTYQLVLDFLNSTKLSNEALREKVSERLSRSVDQARERPEVRVNKLENWNGPY